MKSYITIIATLLLSFTGMAKVNPGEIIILGMEESTGGGAVREIWFLALAPIDAGEKVYFTDGSFSNVGAPFALTLGGKDSYLSFTVGSNGLNVGDTWIIGDVNTTSPTLTTARSSVSTSDITSITSNGAFDLEFGTNGDDLWLYQGTGATATRFIYAVGCGTSGSQLDPAITGVSADIATWGLTEGLTANHFNFGNSNYKMLGANPNNIDFGGSIDDILTALGNSANYETDDALTLNSTGTVNLSISGLTPQPSGRYYDDGTGLWYTDPGFNTLAAAPNRTHNVLIFTTSFNLVSQDTLDVAGLVVGDSTNATTVTFESGSYFKSVYGADITNNSVFNLNAGSEIYLGTDFDVHSGGTANLDPTTHLDFEGDLNVDGVMTLNADATGFSTLGMHGAAAQNITGTGTINAEMYFAHAGWHHLAAPGSITFNNVTFDNSMSLSFSGSSRNIYRWDASRSGWYYTQSTSNFGDSAYTVYMAPAQVPTTATLSYVADDMDADVVSGVHTYTVKYHAPAGNPVNAIGWASGNPAQNAGWNLMKNPFWGHISWEVIDDALPADVNAAVSYWNPSTGGYDTWTSGLGTTDYDIVPLLAYFAQAASSAANNAGLERAQSAIIDGNKKLWLKTGVNTKPQILLYAVAGGNQSRTALMFDDNATPNQEGKFDAFYRGSNPDVPVFATVSADSVSLAIDQRPFPNTQEDIYLTYDFETEGATSEIYIDNTYLPLGIEVYLEDLHTGMIVNLNQTSYSFAHTASAPRQRFILHLTNNAVSVSEFEKDNALVAYRSNGNMVLKSDLTNGDYSVQVMDLSGRLLANEMVTFDNGEGRLNLSGTGPYIVRVNTATETLTIKTF